MIQISKTEFPADYFKYFPVRILAVYEAVTGLLLCFMWLSRIITAACLQTAPIGLEHYSTLTIQALDLAVIVPVIVLTGIAFLLRICLGIRKREREIQVEPG